MAIAKVHSANGDSASASGSQGVVITSTTAGNCLTVQALVGGNTTIAVSDNGGTHATWATIMPATFDSTLNQTRAVFAAYNIPSGITTVTVTYGASSSPRGTVVAEWSGVATSSAFDKGPATQTQTSATPASLNVTPSQNNEVLIGFGVYATNALTVAGAGWASIAIGTNSHYVASFIVQTTATTDNAHFTCTSNYVACDCLTLATSPVSGATLVSTTDTASLDDSTAIIGPQGADATTLDDLNIAVLATDVQTIPDFTLAEQSPTILAPTSAADTFTLSDTATVTVPLQASDAFSVTEAAPAIGLSVQDTLSAVETVSVVSVIDYHGFVVGTLAVAPRVVGTMALTPRLRGTMTVQPAGRP